MEEQSVYHLSDAYEKKTGDIALDLIVQVININTGFNEELKTKKPDTVPVYAVCGLREKLPEVISIGGGIL